MVVEQRHGVEVVDRVRDKALELAGVQVDRDDAVRPGELEHVRHELAGDRRARLVLLVLPRVAKERDDGGDARGAAPLEGVHHDDQLHEVLVRARVAGGLDDEHVTVAHRVVNDAAGLAVLEVGRRVRAER